MGRKRSSTEFFNTLTPSRHSGEWSHLSPDPVSAEAKLGEEREPFVPRVFRFLSPSPQSPMSTYVLVTTSVLSIAMLTLSPQISSNTAKYL
jgi:hypothetical protein